MTATAERFTIASFPRIADNPEVLDELRDGLSSALGYIPDDLHSRFWDGDGEEKEALHEWDRTEKGVIEEVLPDVARLISDALAKRLPWTWEPDR